MSAIDLGLSHAHLLVRVRSQVEVIVNWICIYFAVVSRQIDTIHVHSIFIIYCDILWLYSKFVIRLLALSSIICLFPCFILWPHMLSNYSLPHRTHLQENNKISAALILLNNLSRFPIHIRYEQMFIFSVKSMRLSVMKQNLVSPWGQKPQSWSWFVAFTQQQHQQKWIGRRRPMNTNICSSTATSMLNWKRYRKPIGYKPLHSQWFRTRPSEQKRERKNWRIIASSTFIYS